MSSKVLEQFRALVDRTEAALAQRARAKRGPHPGRLGHLRTCRRLQRRPRRVPQAHRRLRPHRHRPAPDRLHRPLQPRADRRRASSPARCRSSTSASTASWSTKSSPSTSSRASRSWTACSTARVESLPQLRTVGLRQRPLRLEGPGPSPGRSRRSCERRASARTAFASRPASCFGACGTDAGRPLHPRPRPARQGPLPRLVRRGPRRDHPAAHPPGQAGRAAGADRKSRSARSSSISTATWPSSIARTASPCGTTA